MIRRPPWWGALAVAASSSAVAAVALLFTAGELSVGLVRAGLVLDLFGALAAGFPVIKGAATIRRLTRSRPVQARYTPAQLFEMFGMRGFGPPGFLRRSRRGPGPGGREFVVPEDDELARSMRRDAVIGGVGLLFLFTGFVALVAGQFA